jgi:hypothetical protein
VKLGIWILVGTVFLEGRTTKTKARVGAQLEYWGTSKEARKAKSKWARE